MAAGVFFAINAEQEVLYVGQSANIFSRWRSHHIAKKLTGFTELNAARTIRLAWIEEDDETVRLAIEAKCIDNFAPVLNAGHPCRSALASVEGTQGALPTFSVWLNEKMIAANVRQIDLARRTGLSRSYISTVVGGKPNSSTGKPILPSKEIVDKIAVALDTSVVEARRAAGYSLPTQPNSLQSRLETALEKAAKLGETDQALINSILEMLEREIERRLPVE